MYNTNTLELNKTTKKKHTSIQDPILKTCTFDLKEYFEQNVLNVIKTQSEKWSQFVSYYETWITINCQYHYCHLLAVFCYFKVQEMQG